MEAVNRYTERMTAMVTAMDDVPIYLLKDERKARLAVVVTVVVGCAMVLLLMKMFLTIGIVKFCLVLMMGAMGSELFYQRNPALKIQHILIVFNIWVTLAILF